MFLFVLLIVLPSLHLEVAQKGALKNKLQIFFSAFVKEQEQSVMKFLGNNKRNIKKI